MNEDELIFIIRQNLPIELFFDAKGQPVSQVESKMKSIGKVFAYNTTPCDQFGHTLRTRSGHCIQCNTARISFILRHVSYGTVYIAGSIRGQVIKIGTTSDKEARAESLNRTKYGDIDDWEILLTCKCLNAGNLEIEAHKLLKPFAATNIKYIHENHDQQAFELFRCNYERAKGVLINSGESLDISIIGLTENTQVINNYNFRTLRRM